MMRSLYSGVSGLKNHQTRMDVIGNNIANINTIGFKGSRVTFQDMLSQTLSGAASPQGNLGGTNPKQIGLGMNVASIDTNFQDGNVQSTGINTDLCLSGNGFFVVSNGANNYYTRNGAFGFDQQGNYGLPDSGYKVMGWMADANGVINTNGPMQNIVIPTGQSMPAKVTTKGTAAGNLNAQMENVNSVTGQSYTFDTAPVKNTHFVKNADGTYTLVDVVTGPTAATPGNYGTPGTYTGSGWKKNTGATAETDDLTAPAGIQVGDVFVSGGVLYEYLGNAGSTTGKVKGKPLVRETTADVTVPKVYVVRPAPGDYVNNYDGSYTRVTSMDPNKRTYDGTVYKPRESTVSMTAYDSLGVEHVIYGKLIQQFDGTNLLNEWRFVPEPVDSTGSAVTLPPGANNIIKFTASGAYDSASNVPFSLEINTATVASATPLTVQMDFSNLTQYSNDTVVTIDHDGYGAGVLQDRTADGSGTITGGYSNGERRAMAQVAIATFNNPGGLLKEGSSLYSASNNSGEVRISTANNGGAGALTAAAIEMSNVDLSEQFSDMIVTQRGFQSNSKIITVSDEMIETMVNMKR